jgi:hypothetical protein
MIKFDKYIYLKNKKELLEIFEKQNLDFSKYNIDLIVEAEGLSKFKKALMAGISIAALASPYLMKDKNKISSSVEKKEIQKKDLAGDKVEKRKNSYKPYMSREEQEEFYKKPGWGKLIITPEPK